MCHLKTAAFLAVALAATLAVAQQQRIQRDPAQLAREIAERRAQEQQRLADYVWKERTEFKKDNELEYWTLNTVRIDAAGQLEKTAFGLAADSGKAQPVKKKKKSKPLVSKAAAQQHARKRQSLPDKLQALVGEYTLATPEEIEQFLRKATIGAGDVAGTTRIRARDVVHADDELTLWVDSATKRLLRAKVLTHLEAESVTAEVEYRRLVDDGPVYKAYEIVKVPAQRVALTVERFDVRPESAE